MAEREIREGPRLLLAIPVRRSLLLLGAPLGFAAAPADGSRKCREGRLHFVPYPT
jgi:hypothetical protein